LANACSIGLKSGGTGRQVEQPRAPRLDPRADAADLVGRQVAHDDDVAGAEARGEHVADPGAEGPAVHRAVDDHRRRHAPEAQRGDEGGGLPVAVRDRRPTPSAAGRAPAQPRHPGAGAGLVDEDKAARVELGLRLELGQPSRLNIRALLLARHCPRTNGGQWLAMRRLLFSVMR
jgi:hypothetical protein